MAFPSLELYAQTLYNVRMKDRRIYIRVTEEFLKKLEYLKEINGFKTLSETIRKIVEKEYRKEKGDEG